MSGYTRQGTINDGDTGVASLWNIEYDALAQAFSNTIGHKHDGSTAEGGYVPLISNADGSRKAEVTATGVDITGELKVTNGLDLTGTLDLTGDLSIGGNVTTSGSTSTNGIVSSSTTGNRLAAFALGSASTGNYIYEAAPNELTIRTGETGSHNYYSFKDGGFFVGTTKFWNSSNDGGGSGLAADLLDGYHATSFMRSDANTSTTGTLTTSGHLNVNGTNLYLDAATSSNNPAMYFRDENNQNLGLIYVDRGGELLRLRPYTSDGSGWDELQIGIDHLKYNGRSVVLLGSNPQYDDNNYLHLSRNNAAPALYVNQSGSGPIARFLKGAVSTSTTSGSAFEINNDGGFVSDGNSTIEGTLGIQDNLTISSDNPRILFKQDDGINFWNYVDGENYYVLVDRDSNGSWEAPHPFQLQNANSQAYIYGERVVTQSSGKAYDAERFDGLDSSQFLRSDASDVKTAGALIFNDNVYLNFGTGNDTEIFHNGSNLYVDVNNGGNIYFRDGNSSNVARFTFDIDTGNLALSGKLYASNAEITGSIDIDGNIYVGGTSGDSNIFFRDNNSGANRSLYWDDSLNRFRLQDNTGASADILTTSYGKATDSNLFDGLNSTQFLRSDATEQKTAGTLKFNDNVQLNFGTDNDAEIFHNGFNLHVDVNNGGNIYFRDGNNSNVTRFSFDIDNGKLLAQSADFSSVVTSKARLDLGHRDGNNQPEIRFSAQNSPDIYESIIYRQGGENGSLVINNQGAGGIQINNPFDTVTINSSPIVTHGTLGPLISANSALSVVGTYGLFEKTTSGVVQPKGTVAGSQLKYANTNGVTSTNDSPPGTWRCLGYIGGSGNVTLFIRIL